MDGPDRKTPSGLTGDSDIPADAGDAKLSPVEAGDAKFAAAEASDETPQTASTSRSVVEDEKERRVRVWKNVSPRVRIALAIAGGAAALTLAAAAGIAMMDGASAPLPPASAATLAASLAATPTLLDAAMGPADMRTEDAADAATAQSYVWRVAQLADDPSVTLVDVAIDRRPLLAALSGSRVSHREAQRLTDSLVAVHSIEHFGAKDGLTLALDKSTGRIVAYEFATSPVDVWQARAEPQSDGSTKLEARRLDLEAERVRVGRAVVVGTDLRASLAEAGLAPVDDVLSMLDDALEGHAELADIRPGARLRVIATQERVNGAFVRWASLEAVEYFPATPNAPSVRVYWFGERDEATPGVGDSKKSEGKKHHGWYDAKGRQPYHGGFRSPVPLARIASRFNPHRMHPVLHVVMPHNGVDFAAPAGAPVYATAAGIVTSVGNDGPCGNKVEIAHTNGVTSIYCHLSRFAAGLRAGLHVEQRQLIAYVGQTGRVTGPHLHFGIRRGGVFVDPMTLRLDGVRVVPRGQRDEFDRRRAELDAELDEVPLPASSAVPSSEPSEPDTFYEEP